LLFSEDFLCLVSFVIGVTEKFPCCPSLLFQGSFRDNDTSAAIAEYGRPKFVLPTIVITNEPD
jgi:hypothetical protein